jgi:hypothetical protein
MPMISSTLLSAALVKEAKISEAKSQKISEQAEGPQQQFNLAFELGYCEGLTVAVHFITKILDEMNRKPSRPEEDKE